MISPLNVTALQLAPENLVNEQLSSTHCVALGYFFKLVKLLSAT